MTLEQIKQPVEGELRKYEEYLRAELHGASDLSEEMLEHVLSARGKAMRPLLVLLSAALWGGPERGYLPAMLVEMLHTATLVHDDVIDNASLRRGKPSVDAMFGSRRAVLLGDLILARSFGVGMASGEHEMVEYITRCMTDLCEGELLQSEMCDTLETTLPVYEKIIYKKTATLIGTCCGAGAMAAGAARPDIDLMKELGDLAGMAFQIKDDILDFATDTGKPRCNDLMERKITLPLLSVMQGRREEVVAMLRAGEVEKLSALVIDNGGLDAAARTMNDYIDRATALLRTIPPSPYRDSLEGLFGYIAEREK